MKMTSYNADAVKEFHLRFWGIQMFQELLRSKIASCGNCVQGVCEFDHYTYLDLKYHLDDEFIFTVYHDHDKDVVKRILDVLTSGIPLPISIEDVFAWFASERHIFYSFYLRENINRLRYWTRREYTRILVEKKMAMCDYVWGSLKEGRRPWQYDFVIDL